MQGENRMNPINKNSRFMTPPSPVRAFPTEGTNLARILSDPQHRQSFHAQLKKYNPMVVAFYRIGLLPLFGVSRTVMLLTTKGKKSGKLRSTPIGYFKIGGIIHLFSAWGKSTAWYKNMLANPNEVWIQIGMRKCPVIAQTLEEPAEIQRTLTQFITESPSQARYLFGWDPDRDQMDAADFSLVINRVLLVRFVEKTK
jgi:deazaflavin-dependent oxidoreductase (nitroreductase family)